MNMPIAAIFDLDGVLCNYAARFYLLKGPQKNWAEYFSRMGQDAPFTDRINLLRTLHEQGVKIVLLTGRSAAYRALTEDWLTRYKVPYDQLIMRNARLRRKGDKLKQAYVTRYISRRYTIALAFDDHPAIIAMYRRLNIPCMDCSDPDMVDE